MSKIYYISDLHLFHNKVLQLSNRPFSDIEEMHQTIIKNWNQTVTSKDVVYIIGDLGMYHSKEITQILRSLPGRKVLIKGNHDIENLKYRPLRECFVDIKNMDTIQDQGQKIVLCHYPFEEWNGYYRGHYHIHGHIHEKQDSICRISRRYNASVDVIGYTPRDLTWFKENF